MRDIIETFACNNLNSNLERLTQKIEKGKPTFFSEQLGLNYSYNYETAKKFVEQCAIEKLGKLEDLETIVSMSLIDLFNCIGKTVYRIDLEDDKYVYESLLINSIIHINNEYYLTYLNNEGTDVFLNTKNYLKTWFQTKEEALSVIKTLNNNEE